MKDYDLYLFDFDNTLFDTSQGIKEILKHALPAVGAEYNESTFTDLLGLSMDQVFDRCVGDRSKYDAFCDEFMRIVRTDAYKSAVPFPETREVLTELAGRGKHIGVVSGKLRFKIVELLEREGLLDLVETVVGFDDTDRHKPDPDPIILAMSRFDVPKERTLYVGDSPVDPLAAEGAGIESAIVNRHNGMTVDGIECTFEIGSLREVLY